MKRLKCLIVDDEQGSILALESLIKNRHDLLHVESLRDPREVIRLIEQHHIELAFIDLHMPHMHGLELIQQLKDRIAIICCSADRLQGEKLFELDVAFYLNKPIEQRLFDKAIDRAWQWKEKQQISTDDRRILPIDLQEYFMFNTNEGIAISLQLIDIECIEAQRDNSLLTHTDGIDELAFSIGDFEKMLPTSHFIRVHRSFMVARKNIANIDYNRQHIILRNSNRKAPVPIGRKYKTMVSNMLKNNQSDGKYE